MQYIDETGEFAQIVIGAAIGATIGAAVDIGFQYFDNGLACGVDWGSVGRSAAIGAVGGTGLQKLSKIPAVIRFIKDERGGSKGTPRNNQAQNKQVNDIVRDLKLNKKQRNELHREISGQNLGYRDILELAKDMFRR